MKITANLLTVTLLLLLSPTHPQRTPAPAPPLKLPIREDVFIEFTQKESQEQGALNHQHPDYEISVRYANDTLS